MNLGDPADIVKIQIFTEAFRKVREDVFFSVPAGVLQEPIVMKDQWGNSLASGLYYVVVTAGSNRSVGKLLLLR